MSAAVKWRVSPYVFSDIHAIIAKHGMGLSVPDGINPSGPDAAAVEICEKYNLKLGIPLTIIVDYKMDGYDRLEYG